MLTYNNESTVQRTLESVATLGCPIVVADLGSTDATLALCKQFGAKTTNERGRRDLIRMKLLAQAKGSVFYIEPWEMLVQGHSAIAKQETPAYVSVLQDKFLSKDIRVYDKSCSIHNHVFETVESDASNELPVVLSSKGSMDHELALTLLDQWKAAEPLKAAPYYYHACLLLSCNKVEEFFKMAEHYLFLDKGDSKPATMLRYYYAMTHLLHRKTVKPVLQNLNLCMCKMPLMAEFWCLTGDVYYHLLKKFDVAKEFYENAMILGSRRLKNDRWPMDISKYGQYPKKMIESCDQILKRANFYSAK